jgi:hypothetical protein
MKLQLAVYTPAYYKAMIINELTFNKLVNQQG